MPELSAELQALLDRVAEGAARSCGADDAHVSLVEGNQLYTVAHFGPIGGGAAALPLDDTPGGGGGGGEGSQGMCTLIAQIPIVIPPLPPVIRGWYCIYLCKSFSCPPTFWTVQRLSASPFGCLVKIPMGPRPPIPLD